MGLDVMSCNHFDMHAACTLLESFQTRNKNPPGNMVVRRRSFGAASALRCGAAACMHAQLHVRKW
eukprot:scaffold39749_cov41-Tisochrysis_lutea.AAC.1